MSSTEFYMNVTLEDVPVDNYTMQNETTFYVNGFVMSWWEKTLWFLLFGGMVVVATGGNLIVIWIVLTEKRMRTVTNIFLVNLSIADTMVSTLNVVFNSIYMVSGDWPFGRIYCKFSQFVAMLSIAASVFTLMAISMDRYVAIIYPLRPRLSRKTTVCIVIGIWAASSITAAPNFIFYTTFDDGNLIYCYSEWPDGEQSKSQLENIYSIIIMVLTYIVPMLSMGFTYTRMGLMLWGDPGLAEDTKTSNQIRAKVQVMRSKRKVVKMLIVVVTIFGVCWLPFHMYFILYTQFHEINNFKYIQQVYLAIYWLAMSNSMYNPMIYCWLNNRFRTGFKRVLAPFCPCFVSLKNSDKKDQQNIHTNVFSSSGSPEAANRIITDGHHRNMTNRSFTKSTTDITTGIRSNSSSRSNTTTRTTLNGQDSNKLCVDQAEITRRNSIPRASTPV